MRIIAGTWRGRGLVAPSGATTRPTAERLRQAMFDMVMHASWGGRGLIEGALVLDVFAGTGALGLEALSRGAAAAEFFEQDRAALAALRTNIAACGAGSRARIHAGDACYPSAGPPARLAFLDPPYGAGLVEVAMAGLRRAGRLAADAIVIAEVARAETLTALGETLAERAHGAGKLLVCRSDGTFNFMPNRKQ